MVDITALPRKILRVRRNDDVDAREHVLSHAFVLQVVHLLCAAILPTQDLVGVGHELIDSLVFFLDALEKLDVLGLVVCPLRFELLGEVVFN